MEPFSDGARLLLKKTLAIATLAIERQQGPF
jgi:hypothetical protein